MNKVLLIGLVIALGILVLILPFVVLYGVRKRRSQQKQLEALREQVNLLFHRAPCGYHSLDEEGVITHINQNLLDWLGYTSEEVVGRMRFVDLAETDTDEKKRKVQMLINSAGPDRISLNLIKKTGVKLPVILQAYEKSAISGRLFSILDNTDCHEAFDRIKNLDQELESFSYSISHDLRAPLRSIDGYSRILQEDYAGQLGDEGNRVLKVIMNNARRMGTLIDDLLEFGRLGRKVLQYSQIDMTKMAQEIAQDLVTQSPDRTMDVRIAELHPAFADVEMIRLVWHNLLDNAVKYTGKKESAIIEVRSYVEDTDDVTYEIRDNGVGFDMKYASKLFGVFQRLHKIQDFTGTGVGLAIVKRIISRHRGRVWAEGSPEGGAIFYFTIPREDENTGYD